MKEEAASLGIKVTRNLAEDISKLFGLKKEAETIKGEVAEHVRNLRVLKLIELRGTKEKFVGLIAETAYLKDYSEELIWEVYKEVFAQTRSSKWR